MRIETEVALGQLARLKNAFDKLPKVLQRKIIREEARNAAKKFLLPKMKVETPRKTGRLRRALAVRAIKKARDKAGVRMALTSSKFKQGKAGTAWRGVIPFYAGFLEWGWRVGKRSRAILAAQRLASRRLNKENVGVKKDGTLRSRTKIALASAEAANKSDKRKKVEGKEFMRDVAKRYGDIATEAAAKGMATRIVEEFRKL